MAILNQGQTQRAWTYYCDLAAKMSLNIPRFNGIGCIFCDHLVKLYRGPLALCNAYRMED